MHSLNTPLGQTLIGYSTAHTPEIETVLRLAGIESAISHKINTEVEATCRKYKSKEDKIDYIVTHPSEPSKDELLKTQLGQEEEDLSSMKEQVNYILRRASDLTCHVRRVRSGQVNRLPEPEKEGEESADSLPHPTPFAKKIKPIFKQTQPRKPGRPRLHPA